MSLILETVRLGLRNLLLHKLRSLLTVLGIIFGVAAVITMVAIGEGNKLRALADIRGLGANNIIIRSLRPPEVANTGETKRQWILEYGLKRADLARIRETVRPIERIVPMKRISSRAVHGPRQSSAAIFGTTPELIDVTSQRVERGRYLTSADDLRTDAVAVLGSEIARRLFVLEDPLDKTILIDQMAFKVIGVLRPVGLAGGTGSALVGRDLNLDIHVPMSLARLRFRDETFKTASGSHEAERVELSEVLIAVPSEKDVRRVAQQIEMILNYKQKRDDVETIVPLELLEQAERTQRNFNYLLVAIASISLLVGGIGIMNIMLATVTERTREIGIRRALGAKRGDIVRQFLVETIALSTVGGLTGILGGLTCGPIMNACRSFLERTRPDIVEQLPEVIRSVTPIVVPWSIPLAFFISLTIGVVFGLYPARRAAAMDPIEALRHE